MDLKSCLESLCTAVGVGSETKASEVAAGFLREYCGEVQTDALGNVIGCRRCGRRMHRY